MNIIFAKHDGSEKEYCWEVSDGLKDYISKGDILTVDTRCGLDIATATTAVITGKGARDVAEKMGAYFPLKNVISFVNKMTEEYIGNKTRNNIIKQIQQSNRDNMSYCDLPF